jgi:hypothetical protein
MAPDLPAGPRAPRACGSSTRRCGGALRLRAPNAAVSLLGAIDATGYSVIAPTLPHIAPQNRAGAAAIGVLVASFPAGMIAGFALGGHAVQGPSRVGDRGVDVARAHRSRSRLCGGRHPLDVPVRLGSAAMLMLGEAPRRRRFGGYRRALPVPDFRVDSAGIVFAVLALGLVEGVRPLHLAQHWTRPQLGVRYVAVSLVASAAAVPHGPRAPRTILLASIVPVGAGLTAVAASTHLSLCPPALVVTAVASAWPTPVPSASWSPSRSLES